MRSLPIALSTALLALVSLPAAAAQNDLLLPTDYVALPDGKINIATYLAWQTLNGPWRQGVRQADGEVTAQLVGLRASRHFSVGEQGKYTIAPVAVLSASDMDSTVAPTSVYGRSASGLGDLRLGGSFWFHVDHANREYATATLLFTLPTGDYDPGQILNVGENRRKTVLSLGWMQQLGRQWVLDLSPEVAFFGDNTQFRTNRRLSQDVAYAMTGTLRYRVTKEWHWYASAQVNQGGATQVNGVAFTGAPENKRLALGTLLFTGGSSQVQLRYARDIETQNGFRNQGELVLRWSATFN